MVESVINHTYKISWVVSKVFVYAICLCNCLGISPYLPPSLSSSFPPSFPPSLPPAFFSICPTLFFSLSLAPSISLSLSLFSSLSFFLSSSPRSHTNPFSLSISLLQSTLCSKRDRKLQYSTLCSGTEFIHRDSQKQIM